MNLMAFKNMCILMHDGLSAKAQLNNSCCLRGIIFAQGFNFEVILP
jgi:hypothetical protein